MTRKQIVEKLSKLNMYRNITEMDIVTNPVVYIELINELRYTLGDTITVADVKFFDEAVTYLLRINAKTIKKVATEHRALWIKELKYRVNHKV